ncbi:NAD(P)H-binding protein, partial [Pseudomonas syringae group genomosp. 7]|uniref:NAD(P)H-binding protein n=1 Tax=Pseudomonas syringae group genomosp. 7 TaxID=251699 RepID=UPI003770467E
GAPASVSSGIAHRLVEQGYPVRAYVRSDDARAEAHREAGAEVFVGDLLNIADLPSALKGCKRIFFTMSLCPYYKDANLVI